MDFIGHETGARTDDVDDPTTQFDLTWYTSGVGPDDPSHTNHPTKTGTDLLSPWKTYRVYYRTYDEEFVKTNATSGTAAYIYTNLVNSNGVPQYHDTNSWKHVEFGDPIEDTSSTNRTYKWINDVSTNGMRLYDLENDEHYLVVVVGVDKAGNEGPADNTSWTVNNTIKFSLIRGWNTNRDDAVTALAKTNILSDTNILTGFTNHMVSAIQWYAAGSHTNAAGEYVGTVTKDYDLLSWDSRGFQERPDNDWKLVGTVHTNWFVDDGGPTSRGAIRFYRASYKDRWRRAVTNISGQVTAQKPLVSEEVYAQTGVRLRAGRNLVALHGVPYTNTFRGVFGGTETFPGGVDSSKSVCIDFYNPAISQKSHADERYWMDKIGRWHEENDTSGAIDLSTNLLDTNFFARAFSIWLPDDWTNSTHVAGVQTNMHGKQEEPVPYMVWKPIMQVPTNTFCQIITNGTQSAPIFNIVAFRLPVAAGPAQMNLSGKTGDTQWGMRRGNAWDADQIYTVDSMTGNVVGNSMCYCDNDGVWRFVVGDGVVPGDFFKPNDVLVIISKNGADEGVPTWEWRYEPSEFYTLPDRHMLAE